MTDRPSRVALIVVHGVADQRPHDTARAAVDLLIGAAPGGARYAAGATEALRLPVDPMPPRNAPLFSASATPQSSDRSTMKSIAQSLRSDFQREDWTAPDTRDEMMQALSNPLTIDAKADSTPTAATARDSTEPDRGVQISSFLLSKHLTNGAARESWASERMRLQRTTPLGQTDIDVFELYWADLSRLSGSLPRTVTELFTLVFRLSKLGRETVDEARRAVLERFRAGQVPRWNANAWRLCSSLQITLDWLFVNGFAMMMQQLALLGVLLLGFGALDRLVAPERLQQFHLVLVAAIGTLALLIGLYRWRGSGWTRRVPPLLVAAACLVVLVWLRGQAALASVLLVFGLATALNEAALRIADERFPFVRPVGRAMWIALSALLIASAVRQLANGAPVGDLQPWLRAALFGVEVMLQVIKWSWILMVVLLAVWFVSGLVAASRQGHEAKASVASGRLGLGLSIGAFLATSMAIWAMLSAGLGAAVEGTRYAPCLFAPQAVAVQPRPTVSTASTGIACPAVDPCAPVARASESRPVQQSEEACLWTSRDLDTERLRGAANFSDAKPYLQQRYEKTTASFALLVVVILLLLAYLAAMFAPSVLAELQLLLHQTKDAASERAAGQGPDGRPQAPHAGESRQRDRSARRLGHWLTLGYRLLDRVVATIVGAGVALGAVVAAAFLGFDAALRFAPEVEGLSGSLLQPLVITAAGIVAGLVAFGTLLSRHLPALRGPLDVALDVDNHFREFPRTGIPRARIFSRYAALLREVAAGGYDRIVIVAHSQGSVISAELLRYLCSDGHHAPAPGSRPSLDGQPLPPVRLLTLGCPLRQLYAARFPTLYRWILVRRGAVSGPRAADVGVQRWINAFSSGDYVGRWLWATHAESAADDALGHPMVDTADPASFGRSDAYAGFDPMPPAVEPFNAATEVEVCLGAGAHTHYFDAEQDTVAWLIDQLVATA